MEGFKPVIKMKTGGSVSKAIAAAEKKEMRSGMHEDIKEDKKLVKKAINLHDDQLHEGKKTDLTTLKKGGRCKKEVGTVRKYKCGGEVKPKKMADGGLTGNPALQSIVNADVLRRRKAAMGAAPAGGLGAVNPALAQSNPAAAAGAAPAGGAMTPVGTPTMPPGVQTSGPVMKKGGKVKGCK
jgi:hypothetical protein